MALLPDLTATPAADPWGFSSITKGLTDAVGLYTSFNTMQNNQKLQTAQLDLQLAQSKAALSQVNAPRNPVTQPTQTSAQTNTTQTPSGMSSTTLLIVCVAVVGVVGYFVMKGNK